MLEAADLIAKYVGRGRSAFDADPALRDAILYRIVVLGEAAKAALNADPSLEEEFPSIEWSPITRMRDRLTHHYWRTDPGIVWATATDDIPALRAVVAEALANFPAPSE